MPRYGHSGGARPTTLVTPMSAVGLEDVTVASADNYPASNFFIVVGRGTTTEEKVRVGTRSGLTFTIVERGADSTAPYSHDIGDGVEAVFTALEADAANAHTEAQDGVHGLPLGDQVAGAADVAAVSANVAVVDGRLATAEAGLAQAQADITQAQADIADRYTKAETDGQIAAAHATYGDLLNP